MMKVSIVIYETQRAFYYTRIQMIEVVLFICLSYAEINSHKLVFISWKPNVCPLCLFAIIHNDLAIFVMPTGSK